MGGAHSAYERAGGIGLPLQETIRLGPAVAFHVVGIPWGLRSARRGEVAVAVLAGMSLGAAVAHFVIWPTERRLGVLPILTGRAEGLPPRWTAAYNVVLAAWAAAATGALVRETPRRRLPLAVGAAVGTGPLVRWASVRKLRWVEEQAAARPRWWNRAAVPNRIS
jgi:hypothetical protein